MTNLNEIELFILDMDGTIYLGEELIDGAKEFLTTLDYLKKEYIFLTNNSSKNAEDYLKKLRRYGIKTTLDKIVSSGEVTTYYLKKILKENERNVYVVGTDSLINEFLNSGFNVVDNLNKKIDCLVLGFDTTLTYQKLWDAHQLINRGVKYVATNPDLVCPLENDKSMPDCGSMIKLLEASTGKKPYVVGKPNELMVDYISNKYNISKNKIAMVGDRVYTDMKMAENSNITGVLVLSGETKLNDLKNELVTKPDYVIKSVKELIGKIGE